MSRLRTLQDAAAAILQNPGLPAGSDERFVGFGVLRCWATNIAITVARCRCCYR